MQIKISEQTKVNLTRKGLPNKLFTDEIAVQRETMSEEELIKVFDDIWEMTLQKAIINAEPCEAKLAKERLPETYRKYFKDEQHHREFRLKSLGIEFIVQLLPLSDDEYELTQLWRISSSDRDPRWLILCFDTLTQRQKFEEIANRLNWNDAELGKQLLLDFIENFSKMSN